MTADFYYTLKPLLPRWLQITLRRHRSNWIRHRNQQCWPIWERAGAPPSDWAGWPGGKRFAVVLTHDVEREFGVTHCEQLADMEEERGLRSAFGFVPLLYDTPQALRDTLVHRGFEIMVHDAYHDGKLYRNQRSFAERRESINEYLQSWGARGFSSGAMHHKLPWISELDIDYDVSTYDVDPFEPQRCGLGRIFPFWVQSPDDNGRGFVELPYTLPQDFTLFALMRERNDDIWRRKLDWIAAKGGMALIKTHPDYMEFRGDPKRIDSYPAKYYGDFLDYIRSQYGDQAWFAFPSEVAQYWRKLGQTKHDAHLIPPHETFCASCRQAHADGWLSEYPLNHHQFEAAEPFGTAAREGVGKLIGER